MRHRPIKAKRNVNPPCVELLTIRSHTDLRSFCVRNCPKRLKLNPASVIQKLFERVRKSCAHNQSPFLSVRSHPRETSGRTRPSRNNAPANCQLIIRRFRPISCAFAAPKRIGLKSHMPLSEVLVNSLCTEIRNLSHRKSTMKTQNKARALPRAEAKAFVDAKARLFKPSLSPWNR